MAKEIWEPVLRVWRVELFFGGGNPGHPSNGPGGPTWPIRPGECFSALLCVQGALDLQYLSQQSIPGWLAPRLFVRYCREALDSFAFGTTTLPILRVRGDFVDLSYRCDSSGFLIFSPLERPSVRKPCLEMEMDNPSSYKL